MGDLAPLLFVVALGCVKGGSVDDSTLEALVAPLVRPCSILEAKKAPELDSPAVASYLGGHPYAEAGEDWPSCPTCRQELSFIGQVRIADTLCTPPGGAQLFTFYYCWTCSPWEPEAEAPGQWLVRFYSDPRSDRLVRIERRRTDKKATTPCTVSFKAAKSLPDWDGIDTYCPQAAKLSHEANDDEPWAAYESLKEKLTGGEGGTGTVGGYPDWIQGNDTPVCPRCMKGMELLAQIGSDDEAGLMWGDAGDVYLFLCREHPAETRLVMQCF